LIELAHGVNSRKMPRPLTLDLFDQTIADIYESALDPSHWDVALGGMINHTAPAHWDVAFLLWERIAPPGGRFVGAFGVIDLAREGYIHSFAGRHPWSIYAHGQQVGTVVHTDEMLPREEFRQSELYRQFLSAWGMDCALIGAVDRSGPERLGLVVPGPGDNGSLDELAAALRRYLPHLKRATRISRKLGEANLRASNAETALERSPCATIVLGRDLEVQFANALAETFVEMGHVDVRDGRFRLRNHTAQLALSALANGSDPSPSVAFPLDPEGLTPYRVLAMRIDTPIAQTLSGPIEGGAVLLVASAHHGGVRRGVIDRYVEWFGFTPAEARLAAMLAQGQSLEEFATNRGVTVNAGRFLLKGVFAKTGASRQAELVALLRDAPDGWVAQREVAE
jgi:DNA-binding CsgD family transcriptional regulator/PAS domain-containing protein